MTFDEYVEPYVYSFVRQSITDMQSASRVTYLKKE